MRFFARVGECSAQARLCRSGTPSCDSTDAQPAAADDAPARSRSPGASRRVCSVQRGPGRDRHTSSSAGHSPPPDPSGDRGRSPRGIPIRSSSFKPRVADADSSIEARHLLSALAQIEHRDDLGFAESKFVHGSKMRRFSNFDRANFGDPYSPLQSWVSLAQRSYFGGRYLLNGRAG